MQHAKVLTFLAFEVSQFSKRGSEDYRRSVTKHQNLYLKAKQNLKLEVMKDSYILGFGAIVEFSPKNTKKLMKCL